MTLRNYAVARWTAWLFAPAIALTVSVLGLHLAGYDVALVVTAFWDGAFGAPGAFVSSTLVRSVPLIFLGVAVALAFRVGVFNIGADGQFLAGAAACIWVVVLASAFPRGMTLIIALTAGAVAGAGWGFIPATMRRRWSVFEVLPTLMLNFVAAHFISFLVRGPLQEPTRIYPQSSTVPAALQLPHVSAGTRLHVGFLLAVACAAVVWVFLDFRESGLRARLTGANAAAARSAGGIDTSKVAFRAFVVSAALAGLAGAVEVLGVTYALYENLSPGYGFSAIVVALLAGLHPLAVVPSAVALGALDAGAAAMQREAGVPSVGVWIVQGLLMLGIVAGQALRRARLN
ncbi:MAG: ABC transporter permease [Gemmatimonadaceae bacterium]